MGRKEKGQPGQQIPTDQKRERSVSEVLKENPQALMDAFREQGGMEGVKKKLNEIQATLPPGTGVASAVIEAENKLRALTKGMDLSGITEGVRGWALKAQRMLDSIPDIAKALEAQQLRMAEIWEKNKEGFKRMDAMRPFFDVLENEYPDKDSLMWHESLRLFTGPINLYMNANGLQTKEQAQEHVEQSEGRSRFITLFKAYYEEWQAIDSTAQDTDIDTAQAAIRKALIERGLFEPQKEAVIPISASVTVTPDAKTTPELSIEKAFEEVQQATHDALELAAIVSTIYPPTFIEPIDKLTDKAFGGELTGRELKKLAMEKRGSSKEITTLAAIDFEDLSGTVQINGGKDLTLYDREVYNAIITLFVEGGNEYITPQMVYRTMTGNASAYLNPAQAEAISDSITKCMYSRVIINAEEEAKMRGLDSYTYDGNLLHAEKVTASLNGEIVECLHILKKPVLYEYADRKKQIGRLPIKLLNSPLNKTQEITILQGYLLRRLVAMKGASKQSNIIKYETVYKELGITTGTTPGALREKKRKIREHVKKILDYWRTENAINGYTENKQGKELYSVTISIPS